MWSEYVVLFLTALVVYSHQNEYTSPEQGANAGQLHPYLQQKLPEVEGVMRQANLVYGDNKVHDDILDIREIGDTVNELTRYVNSSAATMHVFGDTYVLVGDNVLVMHEHEGNVLVEFSTIIPDFEGFISAQSTLMAEETFIIFLFHDHIEIYTSPNDGSWSTLGRIQSISNERVRPVASETVHCLGRLYLVVAYADRFGGTVNSLIYEWTGSHFDEIYELSAAGAVDLAVILQPNHFYVALAERPPRPSKHCVSIYKIKPGSAPLRHRIPMSAPRRLLAYEHFHEQEETFLLVINMARKGTVLKLEGDRFIQDHILEIGNGVSITTLGYLEAVPVLITAQENSIHLSKLSHSGLVSVLSLHVEGTDISMLELIEVEYGKYRVLVTFTVNKRLFMRIFNIAVRRYVFVRPPQVPPLEACIQHLSEELQLRQNAIIDQLSLKLHQLETSEDVEYDELVIDHEITLSYSKLGELNVNTGTPLLLGEDDILKAGREILNDLREMDEKLPNLLYKDKPILIDYPVVLEGDLKVNKLDAEYIEVEKVNDDEFTSDHFVWDNQDLSIGAESEVIIDELHVVNLTAPTIFLEGFLANPTVESLKVNNIVIPPDQTVNGIYLDQIVLRGEENIIEGKKIIESATADIVYAESLGDVNMKEVLSRPPNVQNLETSGDVVIENLIVDTVNGVNMTKFMNNVFLRDIDTTIEGDITFNEALEIDEIETNIFQGIPVEDMLTKTTDQVITSNVTFDNLYFEEAEIGLINGVNISKDVALLSKHNIIRSPVQIPNVKVMGNVILNCGKRQRSYCNLLDIRPEDNNVQIYEAPVYIDGSLTVNDVKFINGATVVVGDEEFHTDFEKIFWTKSTRQQIPDGVTFNAGLTVTHVDANTLNGVPLENFATIHTDFTQIPVYFNELYLNGDLVVQPWTQCAALAELGRDVVTTHGDYVITGKKIFMGTVEVDHLIADTIDGVELNDIALLDDPRDKTFRGEVRASSVEVKGDLRAYCDAEARLVNEFPLKRVVERALRVDRDAYLESVTFTKSFEGSNLIVQNGPVAEALKNMERPLDGINLTVAGELKLTNGVNQVRYLNGIEFESYIGQVVDKNVGGLVAGKKVFHKGLKVDTALEAKTINGIDFRNIIKNALKKQGTQRITGTHHIEHLYTDQLTTNYLNDLDVDNIADASQPIIINSSLIFEDVNVFGNLLARIPFDLKLFKDSLLNMKPRCWREVNIDGGMDWTIPGALSDIIDNAVHGEHENIVTGNVTFLAPLYTDNLMTNVYLDGVDIQYIANDAVLKSATYQEIYGKKEILGPAVIDELYVEQAFICKNLTGFDLSYINETMARKYEQNYFQGHVTFNGNVSTDYIKANSISGIPDLKDLITTETIRSISNIDISRVRVGGDLRLNRINGLNFSEFLNSIVLTEGGTQYVYGDVEFQVLQIGELETNVINNVNVDDIVFDEPNSEIIIKGDINFEGDIKVDGDINIDVLNNVDIEKAYGETFEVDKNTDNVYLGLKDTSALDPGFYRTANLKEEIYKAINNIDANIDKSNAVLADLNKKLLETKKVYEEIRPKFLYLELVKRLDLIVTPDAHATSSCSGDECSLVIHHANLNCLRGCACISRQLISVDTKNWHVSTTNETLNRRSFIITSHESVEVAMIEVLITENNDNECKINNILKWISSDYLHNDNSDILNLTDYVKGEIVDVKYIYIDHYIVIVILIMKKDVNVNTESVILAIDPTERIVKFQGSMASCGARNTATAVFGDRVHVFFANSGRRRRRCQGSWVFGFNVQNGELNPIESSIYQADRLATSTSDNQQIVVVASTTEGETILNELSYDKENDRYHPTQRIGSETYPVVGLELVNIYGVRNYETVLCSANAEGTVAVYSRHHLKGWQLKSSGKVEGATGLIPLKGSAWPFILVTSSNSTSALSALSLTSSGL